MRTEPYLDNGPVRCCGASIFTGETFRGAVRTAQSRDNKTLQGLELVDAGRNLRKDLKGKSPADVTSVGLHVGIGSSSFKQESEVNQQTYAGGRMMSAGDVTVRAESSQENKGNLTAVGESIQGKNVSLTASGAVRLQAGTNEETIRDSYQSHGASIGTSFHGGLTSIDASYGKMKDPGPTTRVTHTGSHVTAQDSLMMSSGKDTTLVGSQLQGKSVTVKTGGNLHIESVQDSETYQGQKSSLGANLTFKTNGIEALHESKSQLSVASGRIDSNYASVTKQAGIYAGESGFNIAVKGNTHLKGAVIASKAETNKNQLDTASLTMENIHNKAEYHADSNGIEWSPEYISRSNPLGTAVPMGIPMKGKADSKTYSAISDGIITIAGSQTQAQINHDTEQSLNQLEKIFNQKKVEERQKIVDIVSREGFTLIGDMAVSRQKKLLQQALKADKEGNGALAKQYLQEAAKWQEGGEYKVLLHSTLGGLLSSLTGNGFTSGITSAGLNEALQRELGKIKNSELHKLASALIGQVATDSSSGSAIAMKATEYNWLTHTDQMNLLKDYTEFIQLQHVVGIESAKAEYLNKFAYYLALTDYEMGYSASYGTSNQISEDFYDAVQQHDPGAMGYNFGIQFNELINNLVVQYYTGDELDEIGNLRHAYYQSFVDEGRVWKDLAAGIGRSPYAPSPIFANLSDDELIAKFSWGYQPNGQIYVTFPDNSTKLTSKFMNTGDELVAEGHISYVNKEGISVVDGNDGNTYYTMTDPVLKNYGDKLAIDGAAVVEGDDGNHYAIDSDGKYYYTMAPVNTHDLGYHLKAAIGEEVAETASTTMGEKLTELGSKKSISTTVQQAKTLSKSVGGAIGNSVQLGFLLNNISENHERYDDWKYKAEADILDLAGAGAGIAFTGTAVSISSPLIGGMLGIAVSSGINYWVEEKKE